MKGCRPLTDAEVTQVTTALGTARDRALFLLGLKTGFRISELLSLTLGDVFQRGRLVDEVAVARRHMKKKREGRSVPFVNEDARKALELWISELAGLGHGKPETMLFRSREGHNRAISRTVAWGILKKAFAASGLSGKLATHTMRKTFARRMKEAVNNDLQALQKIMGHAQITSTMSYIEVDEAKIQEAFRKS